MVNIKLYKYNDSEGDMFLSNYVVKVFIKGKRQPYEREFKSHRNAHDCVDWLESFYKALDMPVSVDA